MRHPILIPGPILPYLPRAFARLPFLTRAWPVVRARASRNLLAPACAAALLLALPACGRRTPQAEREERDGGGLSAAERRLLYAQVVDEPQAVEECAILEGKAYKHLLRLCAEAREEERVKKAAEKDFSYEQLRDRPDLFRGQAFTIHKCVVIEVFRAELPSEYGLPGYSVLPALLVNNIHELYELRILAPPGSELFEKLDRGIKEGKHPVARVSGYFLKNHAKRTSKAGEPPWQAPLLVCPPPSFRTSIHRTYDHVREDLEEGKLDEYMPSIPIQAPKAEERLVAELLPGAPPLLRIEGEEGALGDEGFIRRALERFLPRLPADQRAHPSAVVLVSGRGLASFAEESLAAFRKAGVKRVYGKWEDEAAWEGGDDRPKPPSSGLGTQQARATSRSPIPNPEP